MGRCDATVQFERGGEPQAATANASKWIRKGMNSPRRRFPFGPRTSKPLER